MEGYELGNNSRDFNRLVKEMFLVAKRDLLSTIDGDSNSGDVTHEYGFQINYLDEDLSNEHDYDGHSDAAGSHETITMAHSLYVERAEDTRLYRLRPDDFIYRISTSMAQSVPLHEMIMPAESWLGLADEYDIDINESLPKSKYAQTVIEAMRSDNWSVDSEVFFQSSYSIEPMSESIDVKFSREGMVNGSTYDYVHNYGSSRPENGYLNPDSNLLSEMDNLMFDSTVQKLLEDDEPSPADIEIAEALAIVRCISARRPWLKNNNFING